MNQPSWPPPAKTTGSKPPSTSWRPAPSSWFPGPEEAPAVGNRALPRTPLKESGSAEGTIGRLAEAPIYHDLQHDTWKRLCSLQRRHIAGRACEEFIVGREAMAFPEDQIPTLAHLDQRLWAVSKWHVVRANGYVRPEVFFGMLENRTFPCMDQVRHVDEVLYSPEPDMFHDVMGHLPLLADPIFCEYYHLFGRAGRAARHREQVACLDKIYWFTMEFGVLAGTEGRPPRVYGAALATGLGELIKSVEPTFDRRPFHVEDTFTTETDVYKPNTILYEAKSTEDVIAQFLDWAIHEQLL